MCLALHSCTVLEKHILFIYSNLKLSVWWFRFNKAIIFSVIGSGQRRIIEKGRWQSSTCVCVSGFSKNNLANSNDDKYSKGAVSASTVHFQRNVLDFVIKEFHFSDSNSLFQLRIRRFIHSAIAARHIDFIISRNSYHPSNINYNSELYW